MAFVDACWFTAGSSGTADFADGTALSAFRNMAGAGAADGEVYSYRAESIDRTEWEMGYGAYSSSGNTLARTVTASSAGGTTKVDFSAAPIVSLQPLARDLGNLVPFTPATSSVPASLDFAEQATNGTNKVTLQGPSALASDVTVTLPSKTGTVALESDIDGTSLMTRVRVVDTTGASVSTAYENGDTIDGVVLATNDLVLRATPGGNAADGIYLVPSSGAASRVSAFATWAAHPGVYVSVMEGTVFADTLWRCTSNLGGTLGSTALAFARVDSNAAAQWIFTSSGTWTVPAGTRPNDVFRVRLQASGGGGMGGQSGNVQGGGGGGGAYGEVLLTGFTAGNTHAVTVPAAGSAGASNGGGGGAGSAASFVGPSVTHSVSGGSGSGSGSGGGPGTTATNMTLVIPGQRGQDSRVFASGNWQPAGDGGNALLGFGGRGTGRTVGSVVAGSDGSGYGSGGGGGGADASSHAAGGAGAPGLVIIEKVG